MYNFFLFLFVAIASAHNNGVVLVIIDGFGESPLDQNAPVFVANAVEEGLTPNMDLWKHEFPFTNLLASEVVVGLREGDVGNSIVGHQTIGLGRTEPWYPLRIELDAQTGSFMTNQILVNTLDRAKEGNGRLHVSILLDDTSVDADYAYLLHLINGLDAHPELSGVYIHIHTTSINRDPSYVYLDSILGAISNRENIHIGTVMGGFYTNDRTFNWEESTKVAYEVLFGGRHVSHVPEEELLRYIQKQLDSGVDDYYLNPILVDSGGVIQEGDTILTLTYREDGMIQFAASMGYGPRGGPDEEPNFVDFESEVPYPGGLFFTTITQYDFRFDFPVMYPPHTPENSLGQIVSDAGMRQIRIAETYKMRHIQAFFSGGVANSEPYPGEDRVVLETPSPRVPAMAMYEVGEATEDAINSGVYDLIVVNLAGPDALGHQGYYPDVVDSVTVTDEVLGRMLTVARAHNYVMIVTSDHGHSEKMVYLDGAVDSGHTRNPVPFFLLHPDYEIDMSSIGKAGSLANIASSILSILDLEPSDIMEPSLLVHDEPSVDEQMHTISDTDVVIISSVSVVSLAFLFVCCGFRRRRRPVDAAVVGINTEPNGTEKLSEDPDVDFILKMDEETGVRTAELTDAYSYMHHIYRR